MAILRAGRLVVVDTLEHLRSIAVRRLDIEFASPPSVEDFTALPGMRQVEVTGNTVQLAFEGSADALLKAAARYEVLEIRSRQDDLEDIFLNYFREQQA